MYKRCKEFIRALEDFPKMSKELLYGSHECAMNLMLFACIPDSNTMVMSFAHNEEEDVKGLKFDLHVSSVSSCREFFKNQIMLQNALGYVSDSAMERMLAQYEICNSYNDVLIASFDCLESTVVPFEVISDKNGGVVVTALVDVKSHSHFLNNLYVALSLPMGYAGEDEDIIDTVIRHSEWCHGDRFIISSEGIKYNG